MLEPGKFFKATVAQSDYDPTEDCRLKYPHEGYLVNRRVGRFGYPESSPRGVVPL